MNEYSKRIDSLRNLMKEGGIDIYYIPMSDTHDSEYVSDHFKCIQFISGFSGSAGHVIVSQDNAWIFVDGRYYIQAANEIAGTGIELMKWGERGVPEPEDFIKEVSEDKVLGFDGAVVSANTALKIGKNAKEIKFEKDLVNEIWEDRPEQIFTEIYELPIEVTGESSEEKIARVREVLEATIKENGLEKHVKKTYSFLLNSLDDIAWIFNIRANDIPCNPEAYAYATISGGVAHLFTNGKGYSPDWYKDESIEADCILMDQSRIGYSIYRYFKDKNFKIINVTNPSTAMKGIKNKVEINNLKEALKRDSAVIIRLMKWLKEKAFDPEQKEVALPLSELSIQDYLLKLRQEDEKFIEPSFDTICAYKENAAMMHYSATPEKYSLVKPEGMLLIDSGGQYKDGTTDITRTFVVGELTEEEKQAFTLTAVSMLRLLNVKFIDGCRGENLDIYAREPMWQLGMDYKCGTGHGVGHILNVHEGPHNIRWKIGPKGPSAVLEEGMVVTNEPGVYRENKFGIRTENEMLVVPFEELGNDGTTPDGKFYKFENLTFIPIDPDGISDKYLTCEDKVLLNEYHKQVRKTMREYLDEETYKWLEGYTKEI